jgi:6-phosphofructokinase 2
MSDIITITANPSIDVSIATDRVAPMHKLRSRMITRDPGGGGINVARVLKRLGADVLATYPAGGVLGKLLRELMDREGVPHLIVPISGDTREDVTVLEEATGQQFRFILPGPRLTEEEWRTCLEAFTKPDRQAGNVVVSGSLPPGVPEDFYAQIARAAKSSGRRIFVDTSGPALMRALEAGVYLIKPSQSEFNALIGTTLETEAELIAACQDLIAKRQVQIVALTRGDKGALLVTGDQTLYSEALPLKPVSVVGAGDSFLGAFIWSLCAGDPLEVALRYGVAAGSAALLAPGTELCRRNDVERLFKDVRVHAL